VSAGREHVEASFYVQIQATRNGWAPRGPNGEQPVSGAKAVRMTLGRPDARVSDAVMVRLTVRLPIAAFAPLEPQAVVEVPASMIERAVIEVTADEPGEEPQ
jgi:hypothetical protein